MITVRRLYFYALSLISFEVVIWGAVSLLRTILSNRLVGGGSLLATGLSMVLVGIPIFWLHWRTAQRDALSDPEERSSRIRAVFLYAARIGVLGPIVYAVLALLDRGLVLLFGLDVSRAWLGGQQSNLDNLIAIMVNLIALVYFLTVLRSDWQANSPENYLAETRRLYRYLWVLFGLTLTVSGVYNLLRYLLYTPGHNAEQTVPMLAGGIALLVVGTPIWYFTWSAVMNSLVDPVERRSLLRLVVLYLISLAGVVGVLASAGRVLNSLIRWAMGEQNTLVSFLQANSTMLGVAIPLAVLWWYYGKILNEEVAAMPDQPRRAGLRRLYDYLLSALGLGVAYAGLISLVDFLANLLFSNNQVVGFFGMSLSGALSALLVGMPLWLVNWREMQSEAALKDTKGDHARRSVMRKAYLYLALFLLVVGAMAYTGQFLYTVLNALLSGTVSNIRIEAVRLILALGIDLMLLIYHWRALREDSQQAQETLGVLHAAFPTLILSEPEDTFASSLVQALERIAPRLPVAIHPIERGAPDELMLGAKAVLLPVGLAMNPPESLHLWLSEFTGRKILVPLPAAGWSWMGLVEKRAPDLARESAQAIRQMAEGESVRTALPNSPWAIVGYVLGGIFGLILLMILFSVLLSSLIQ